MEDLEELKCIVCFEIFEEPLSLYCGHTFCKVCLLAHLDKSPKCPICKFTSLNKKDFKINELLNRLIKKHVIKDPLYQQSNPQTSTVLRSSSILKNEAALETLRSVLRNMTLKSSEAPLVSQICLKMEENRNRELSIQNNFHLSFNIQRDEFAIHKLIYDTEVKTIKNFCFQISPKQLEKYFINESIYTFNLLYTYSDDLYYEMMTDKMFGVITENDMLEAKQGYLFELLKTNHFSNTEVNVTARCINKIDISQVHILDISEHFDHLCSLERYPQELEIYYLKGETKQAKNFQFEDRHKKLIKQINFKFIHFINELKKNKMEMYDELSEHYNVTVTDQSLSIDYNTDTEKYLNFLFALLRIPETTKARVSQTNNPIEKLRAIKNFLDRTRPNSDPIYVLNYSLDIKRRINFHASILGIIFMTLIYSVYMVHFNVNFIF